MNLLNELSASEQRAALELIRGGGGSGGPPEMANPDLPTIVVNNRHLPEVVEETREAIIAKNDPPVLFKRGAGLARIAWVEDKERGQNVERPIIDTANETYLRGLAARAASFVRVKESKTSYVEIPVDPPLIAVRDILAMGEWAEIPLLMGITQAPILHNAGEVHDAPGYDSESCLYYAGGVDLPDVPKKPTPADVLQAVGVLKEPFLDFPFADDQASMANALATILAIVLRPLIHGPVPAAVLNKHQQGSGATLLSNVFSIIGTGLPAHVESLPTGRSADEELRKLITSILIAGRPLVVFDNVDHYLNSAVLGAVLTTERWEDRLLGRNELVTVPQRSVWLFNGNNVQLGGDLPRRCFEILLDPKMPRPWLRSPGMFRHPDLLSWTRENRGQLLSAVFTMARGWIQAGRPLPDDLPALGGFEEFVKVVGGILTFAGVKGFLTNLTDLYEKSEQDDGWTGFLHAWYEVFGNSNVTVAKIIDEMQDNHKFGDALPPELSLKDKELGRKLGWRLKKREGFRHTNGLYIERAGTFRRAIEWKVCLTEGYTLDDNDKETVFVEAELSAGTEESEAPY